MSHIPHFAATDFHAGTIDWSCVTPIPLPEHRNIISIDPTYFTHAQYFAWFRDIPLNAIEAFTETFLSNHVYGESVEKVEVQWLMAMIYAEGVGYGFAQSEIERYQNELFLYPLTASTQLAYVYARPGRD